MEQQTLGDYKVLKQIGQGALGGVWLAEHRFIKKPYVLKILPKSLGDDRAFVTRFEEQVAKLAQLSHPHIVKIHNISFADGVYFIVTDCVVDPIGETTNLGSYMAGRKERLREEELVKLLSQIAGALDHAHGLGVIHQALKLSNILIGKGKLEVAISDFGLSHVIGPPAVVAHSFAALSEALALPLSSHEPYATLPLERAKLSKLTQSFLQGYAFLAPEQKRLGEVDATADTYAFGVLAYYLIAGVFPEGNLEMPSEVAPEYTHNWDRLVSECLEQRAQKRPRQLQAVLQAIAKAPATVPLRAPPVEEVAREKASVRPFVPEPEVVAPKLEVAAVKSVESATPAPITPKQDDSYKQALHSMLNREPVVTEYQPEKKEKSHIEPIGTEMVVIEGGEYFRGSNEGNRDESPQHQIQLDRFKLDIHPVTNEQFCRFLEFMGGEKDQNYHDLIRLKESRINRAAGRLSIESGYAKHPVVGVTWYGAVAYAKWVGCRLPTEAEWEVACQGGLGASLYPTGDSIEKNQANFFSSDTTPVMSYAPNGYGLYDIVGNVYEWCQDWYGYNFYETSAQEPVDPKGPIQGVYRVLRGGCWKSLQEDLRCSHRHRNNPGTVNGTYGFRCASDV